MKRITIGLLVVLGDRHRDRRAAARATEGRHVAVVAFIGASRRRASGLQVRPDRGRDPDPAPPVRSGRGAATRGRSRARAQDTTPSWAPPRVCSARRPRERLLDKRLSDADLEALRAKSRRTRTPATGSSRWTTAPPGTSAWRRFTTREAGWAWKEHSRFRAPENRRRSSRRNASLFDDDPEDGTISQTFFSFGGRGPEARVVRLRPNTDEVWGAYVAAHRPKVEELRREVRSTLETYFGK